MKRNHGFTLVELMVVIVIIGILAGVSLPRFMDIAYKARTAEIPPSVNNISSAQAMYYAENNSYITCPWADVDNDNSNDNIELYFNLHLSGEYFYYGATTPAETYNVEVWASRPFAGIAVNTKAVIDENGDKTFVGDDDAIANLQKYCLFLQ